MHNSKPFWFRVPQYQPDHNNNSQFLVGHIDVWAIVYLFDDGTFRSVDIDQLHYFRGSDSTGVDIFEFVKDTNPDLFEDIERKAVDLIKTNSCYVTSEKSSTDMPYSE